MTSGNEVERQIAGEIGTGCKFYYCGSDEKNNSVGVVLDAN